MKKIRKLIFALILIVLFYFIFCWKIPVILSINGIKLPENCEVIYDTKVEFSDVYEDKILGEKVVRCDEGYEYVKNYVEENNSLSQLEYVNIVEYFGMIDDAVYYPDIDTNFKSKSMSEDERDQYIKIRYRKEIFGMPWHYMDIYI